MSRRKVKKWVNQAVRFFRLADKRDENWHNKHSWIGVCQPVIRLGRAGITAERIPDFVRPMSRRVA